MGHFESNEKDIYAIFINSICGVIINNYFTTL